MLKALSTLALLLLAGCADPVAVDGDDPDAPARGAAVRGMALDHQAEGVADAFVLLRPGGQTTTTDESGAFALNGLVPGTHRLFVSKEGYEWAPETLELEAGWTDIQVRGRATSNQGDT